MRLSFGSSWALAVLVGAFVVGCGDDDTTPPVDLGGTPDLASVDGGGDTDGGTADDMMVAATCEGMAEGAVCDAGGGVDEVCIGGACVPSVCGDGATDARTGEDCDDGNAVSNDGCEPDCTFTCAADADCVDAEECNGAETCVVATHLCEAGTPLATASACARATGEAGECTAAGVCAAAGCGNGTVTAGEDCDDGNTVSGDGCENDCTFSCVDDADCDNGNLCDGVDICVAATHVCASGAALTCDDGNDCTTDSCDPVAGCVMLLIDADGDGASPTSAGACGTDCDDTDPLVFPGAAELCDGVDNDCNGAIDEAAPTWYIDCDGDGFAASTTGSVADCVMPTAAMTGCPRGTARAWTSLEPTDIATTDCYDANALVKPTQVIYQATAAAGRPAAVDFDYDCDAMEERQYTTVRTTGSLPLSCVADATGTGCVGQTYWVVAGGVIRPPPPACGVTGTLSICARNRLLCTRSERATPQRCL